VSPRPEPAGRILRCHAPGKLNLGLRVVGRRADGYHELESLFAPLDLGDDVEVAVSESKTCEVALRLEGACEAIPDGAGNLAHRAAADFAKAAGLTCRIELRIEKRLPAGAGLGGGSSDAGAVLRALDELFPGALDGSQLAAIALGLGADVPFFLDPRPARIRGIGERIEAVDALPSLPVLLANPGVALATADVFRAFAAIRPALTNSAADRRIPRPSGASGPGWTFESAAKLDLTNDLEPIAIRLCPPIARLSRRIEAAGALAVGMSGSGATVFGLFESMEAAKRALEATRFEAPVWARVAATQESR